MSKNKTVHIKVGARILSVLFVLLFFGLGCRFVYIQVTKNIEGQVLTTLAEDKWKKERVIEASRGQILDRNSEVIAEDVPTYTMYAIIKKSYSKNSPKPLHVDDPHDAAMKLAPFLEMEVSEIERKLIPKSENDFQVEFGKNGRNIDHMTMEKIAALKIPGINFKREKIRLYPNGVFASHVIGFALPDKEGKLVGSMGVEKTFDSILQGKDGLVTYQSDRKGFKLPDPKEMVTSPTNGKSVYLTIDQKIQTFLESALDDAAKEYKPENMIGIVANAKTGEILAMATRPSFDPNIRDITNYMNDAISSRYEPGSTMKVFTLAAAIDAGVFQSHDVYQSGSYRLSERDKPIRDHNKSGWGQITYLEGVQRSSNVAFAKLVNEKLGTDRFLEYLQRFKFDQPTGIDLPNEVAGNILFRYPIEKITTAFGQGTSITPIQQIQAATAISNGGKMMKPHIIKKIVDPRTGEVIKEQQPTVVGEPIQAETAGKVLDILETVVSSEAGTGKAYRLEGYQIAGKTGTAQFADPKTGEYMIGHGNNIFSFLGFVPKDDPQLIMYVSVKQPKLKDTELGSEPIAYVFKTVMKNSLHYLNIVPTENVPKIKQISEKAIDVPSVVGKSLDDVKTELLGIGTKAISVGSTGKVKEQLPLPKTKVLPGEIIVLKAEGKMIMPEMTGWSLRDVIKITKLMNLKPNVIGSGYVTNQNIKPGSEVKEGDYLVVDLRPPYEENDESTEQKEEIKLSNKEDQEIFDLLNNVQD